MAYANSATLGLVLDLDPDLGAGIPEDEREHARNACRGAVVRVPRGRWTPPAAAAEREDQLGLVILEGLLCRELAIGQGHALEFLGPGDVVQLPTPHRWPSTASEVRLTAATKLLLVSLRKSFLHAAGRWPTLLAEVHQRLEAQRQRLAIQTAILHLPRAEDRVLLALWHLAHTWGRITPAGTVLPLPLTHDVIGHMAAARRPTVTVALSSKLHDCITRTEDGSWLLTTAAEARVQLITQHPAAPSLGATVMLRELSRETRDEARALRDEAAQIRAHRRAAGQRRTPS